jgi:CDGSH-type Zn-finger protein
MRPAPLFTSHPSGAIFWWQAAQTEPNQTREANGGIVASTRVTIFNNGSIRIEGDFEIVDQTGNPFGLGGRTTVTLCRCGRSANQPFCDGAHKRENFVSAVSARDLPPIPRA